MLDFISKLRRNAKLIDVKTKCYEDRRGLEQEEVGALLLVIRDNLSECLRR